MSEDRYKYFRIEAREILEHLGQDALDLEKGIPAPELVSRMLRLAHTLKGAARVVKLRAIADHAHALEDTLGPVRDASGPVPVDVINRVIAHVDDIATETNRLTAPPAPVADAPAANRPDGGDQPLATFRPAMDDLDALLGGVFEAHVRLGALRPRIAGLNQARQVSALVVDQLGRAKDQVTSRLGGVSSHDRLRSMVEDLRGMVDSLERDFRSNIDHLDQELLQVREAAERLRLSPAAALFTFLERAVRDVAQALRKRIVFEVQGGDVRVDPTVLAVVQGALLHVVRNAAAHGIEDGERERRAAGKPSDGNVSLSVSQRGRLISFVVTDDGRGIDLEAVRRVAQRKGIVREAGQALPTEELLRVLFKGGISTSPSVTDVSGRGIGLDVVREAAERLGGEVKASTEAGRGTSVELTIPVSIASFQALVVDMGAGQVTIPLDAVRGTVRLAPDQIIRTAMRESILFEGRTVPFVSLRQILTAAPQAASALDHYSAVVIEGRTGMAAFATQRILGTAHVVMRPLPAFAPARSVVAGAALDAVGDPQLVLDADELVAAAQREALLTVAAPASRRSVLVIDDSLTTRMLEQSILESAGYHVDLATSGEEGLEKARTREHDLFLVDVEMPGMDGFTFIRTIRADPHLRGVPAILVTSRNSVEDLQSGVDAGAQAHMTKSEFDQGILLDRIRTLIG